MTRQFQYHVGAVTDEHEESGKLKSTATTQLVSRITFADNRTLDYEYDAEERITSVVETYKVNEQTFTNTTLYTYDALGQLLTETVNDTLVNVMTYDNYGNILTKNGIAYTYQQEGWKDLLIQVGEGENNTITYDAQGNPTSYLGHTLTWEKGRQLKSFDSNTYTYNANGIRTSKTVAGVKHDYILDGTKILRESWNYDEETKTYQDVLIPLYDNEDSVCGIIYNGEPYYFQKNLQGDVIAITDENGGVISRYSHDAWGANTGIITCAEPTDSVDIANINPFRYRSYYFDKEIEMYYLQSRYYDPQTGRFINADNLQILGILFLINHITLGNLFSYCGNAPVADKDIAGAISEHDLSALLDPLSVFERFVTSLYQDLKNGLLLVGAYATKILSPIAVKALWWKPIVAIALVALAVALVVIAVSAVYNAKKAKKKGKTPIPSQLKNGSKVKTPTSHKGEFSDKKRGKYTHKKTKWKFEKSKDGHYNGEHWHAYPENAQTGDYYNISPDGRVLS